MPVTSQYSDQFVEHYDLLYGQRDIASECRTISGLLGGPASSGSSRRLLDFGCGTGGHALGFAGLGWQVSGVDPCGGMIVKARQKLTTPPANVRFLCADAGFALREFGEQYFDAAVSLFNVFNCMPGETAMQEQLAIVGRLLKPGARCVLDLWNGAAVLAGRPRCKIRRLRLPDQPGRELTQKLVPELDRQARTCTLHYTLELRDARHTATSSFEEQQVIHFCTPDAYHRLFRQAGFTLEHEHPTGCPGTPLTDREWFMTCVLARA